MTTNRPVRIGDMTAAVQAGCLVGMAEGNRLFDEYVSKMGMLMEDSEAA